MDAQFMVARTNPNPNPNPNPNLNPNPNPNQVRPRRVAKRPYQTYKQRMRALNDLKEQIHNQKEHKEQKEQKAAAAHISAGLTPVCVDLSFGGATLGTLQLALRN